MLRKLVLTAFVLVSVALPPPEVQAKKVAPGQAKPPWKSWAGLWHTAATVDYSSCPGTEPGHQAAFTISLVASEDGIRATEMPEQSLARKFTGQAELRGRRWVLQLRDKDGKNGMDLWVDDDGRKLRGTRVVVRPQKKKVCAVVYSIEGTRDES